MIKKRQIIATLATLLAMPTFVSAVAPSTESKFLNALAASKLQYPESGTDADSATLLGGHDQVWFTLSDTDKMTFTHGTDAERSELRNLHNWNVNATVQTAHGNVAVISQAADQVTIMQIHDDANVGTGTGPNKPLLRIYRDDSEGKAYAIIKADDGGVNNLPLVDLGTMTLGAYYDCDITVDNGKLTVNFGNAVTAQVNEIDVSYWNFPSYWKAGLYLQDTGPTVVRFNELTWPGAKAVVDDDFADVDRTSTGALDADWWSSNSTGGNSVEVDGTGLGLVSGTSGRGIHGTFSPQTLAIGETLTTTLSFTTPATVGVDKSGGLKVALMDFNDAGLADNLLSESATSNPLYENLPGYYIEFDVNKIAADDDITIRKHDVPNAIGRFLGTSSEWSSLGNSADVGYDFTANKDYTVVVTVTRTSADTLNISGILQDEDGAVLDLHTEEDVSGIANHFGMVGVWANGGAFGSTSSSGAADNGITITNAKVELLNLDYNQAPAFTFDPTVGANATQDAAYSSSLAGDASDLEGDAVTYSKVSGPAWLTVASNGDLSGTPASGDVGPNAFVVQVADAGGSTQAALNVTVDALSEGGPVTIVNDNFTDLDRTSTGDPDAKDAAWWSSNSTSGNSVEIDSNGLGLISGSSGRGLHGTFEPQTLDVGGSITATLTFTTPSTVGSDDNGLKFALMDYNNLGLAADLLSSSSSANSLYTNFPGYMVQFDVNDTINNTNIRKHVTPNTSGRFLGTSSSSEWSNMGQTGDDMYSFLGSTEYVVVLKVTRTGADTADIFSSLSQGGSVLTSHTESDASVIANNFGVLGVWANSGEFGTNTTSGDADNGITFSNITVVSEGTVAGNQAPVFSGETLVELDATQGVSYAGNTLADDASDFEGDDLTFTKTSGPVWLSVATDGTLSGTPTAGDVGLNTFGVEVTATGGSDTAVLNITVVAPFAGGTLFDDSFADTNRASTGTGAGGTELDADWWGSSGSSAIEIDATGLGLRSGTSGRGIHGTFTPQNLAVGDSLTATMTFTTPATVASGSGKSTALKFALMDLNNGALASDVGTSNPLWSGVPGYMIDFDVNTGSSANITAREHDILDTQGKFLGTTSEWDTISGSPSIGYVIEATTSYAVVLKVTRTNTGSMDIFASLSLSSGGEPLATYNASDVDGTVANNFGLLGVWVNSNTFGTVNTSGVPDNGITFTNVKVETSLDVSGNTAPVATDNTGSIDETALAGDDVLTVLATDDSGISSFEIIAGNTGDAFSIDSNGLIEVAAALDAETTPSYSLTVQVTDDGISGLKDTATVTITVNEVVAGYATWASGFSLVDGTETGDDDLDNIENVLEYILGGDPTVADLSILPNGVINGSNYELSFTRSDASEDDATSIVQFGSDLTSFPATTVIVPAASGTIGSVTFTITENDISDDDVTASIPHEGATEFFGRINGSLNP